MQQKKILGFIGGFVYGFHSGEQRSLKLQYQKYHRRQSWWEYRRFTAVAHHCTWPQIPAFLVQDDKALACYSDRAFCWHLVQEDRLGRRLLSSANFQCWVTFLIHVAHTQSSPSFVSTSASCRHSGDIQTASEVPTVSSFSASRNEEAPCSTVIFKKTVISYSYGSWQFFLQCYYHYYLLQQ